MSPLVNDASYLLVRQPIKMRKNHYLLKKFTKRHYLLVGNFSEWPPMNVALMFYTFGEIKQIGKTALI